MASSGGGTSVGELATLTGLNRSTIYRLLGVLERCGWLKVDAVSRVGAKSVRLGVTALGFSVLVASKYDFASRLQPFIDELARTVDETVHVGILDGSDVVHVARAEPALGPHMAVALGARSPAQATGLGKAILSTLPTDAVTRLFPAEELVTLTDRGFRTRTALLAELDATARRGYAIDDEEARLGVRCVAAPVYDASGTAHLAISVTSPLENLRGERLLSIAAEVQAVAATLGEVLAGVSLAHRATDPVHG